MKYLIILLILGCSRSATHEFKKPHYGYADFTISEYNGFCNKDPKEIYIQEFVRIEGKIIICKETQSPTGLRFRKRIGDPVALIAKYQSYLENRPKNLMVEEDIPVE